MLNADAFWVLIDKVAARPVERQNTTLRGALRPLSDADLAWFAARLERILVELDSPALAKAASIVFDGVSDDGYEYFRRWIVTLGRSAYERIRADAATLVDYLGADPDQCQCEALSWPAMEYLSKRLGEERAWRRVAATEKRLLASEGPARRGRRKKLDVAALRERIEGDRQLQARRREARARAKASARAGTRKTTRSGIPVGSWVRHPSFGKGKLLGIELFGELEIFTIGFDNGSRAGFGFDPGDPEMVQCK
jgi:hypothetical protein